MVKWLASDMCMIGIWKRYYIPHRKFEHRDKKKRVLHIYDWWKSNLGIQYEWMANFHIRCWFCNVCKFKNVYGNLPYLFTYMQSKRSLCSPPKSNNTSDKRVKLSLRLPNFNANDFWQAIRESRILSVSDNCPVLLATLDAGQGGQLTCSDCQRYYPTMAQD